MNNNGCEITFYSQSLKNGFNKKDIALKARFIYDTKDKFETELSDVSKYIRVLSKLL